MSNELSVWANGTDHVIAHSEADANAVYEELATPELYKEVFGHDWLPEED